MFKYDRNTGNQAKVGDRIEFCHTASSMDGMQGRIGGWGDYAKTIALVILDEPTYVYDHNKLEVVGMPVVCCRKLESTVEL